MGQLTVGLSAKIESLQTQTTQPSNTGVSFPRYFTARLAPGQTPFDEVRWETRTASIGNDKGAVIFEQRDVEVPPIGRRRPPTSSPASTFTASWDRRSARPA